MPPAGWRNNQPPPGYVRPPRRGAKKPPAALLPPKLPALTKEAHGQAGSSAATAGMNSAALACNRELQHGLPSRPPTPGTPGVPERFRAWVLNAETGRRITGPVRTIYEKAQEDAETIQRLLTVDGGEAFCARWRMGEVDEQEVLKVLVAAGAQRPPEAQGRQLVSVGSGHARPPANSTEESPPAGAKHLFFRSDDGQGGNCWLDPFDRDDEAPKTTKRKSTKVFQDEDADTIWWSCPECDYVVRLGDNNRRQMKYNHSKKHWRTAAAANGTDGSTAGSARRYASPKAHVE